MKAAEVAHFEGRLRARHAELRQRIRDALVQSGGHYGQLAGEVHDAGEESLADLLADVDLASISREVQEVRDIDAARLRILGGRYGLCVQCGGPIDPRRLEAYPTAKRCLACQRAHERARSVQPPPAI